MVAMLSITERTSNNYFSSFLPTVNSPSVPHRDVTGTSTASYRSYNDDYTSVQRRPDKPNQPDVEAERTKKDKKWSIGKLFRRKKKDDESGSSSQSEEDISGRSPKRKAKKKKKAPPINNFDHIVIRDSRRAQSLAKPNFHDATDDGVLSDPSAGFINYRAKTHLCGLSKESFSLKDDHIIKLGRTSTETPSRKSRKGRLKARVEALRNSMKGDSSSDEESLKSSNSSSMIRFRSEDSLMRSRDSSLNKKSRSARNERYIKRLSRDEENQLNKEAELLQQGYSKAEIEMLTRTPTSQSSGYGTCKREPSDKPIPEPNVVHEPNRLPMKSESVSSFPSTQSYPSSINFKAKVNNEHINYCIQYPNNNNTRDLLYGSNNRERTLSNNYDNPETVMCVKFPLGNVTNVKKEERAPPVPPPRDMHRKVTTPLSMYYENNPIVADRGGSNYVKTHGVPNNDFERIMRKSQERSLGYGQNGLRRPISNSEDHIAMQNNENTQNIYYRIEQPRRPASVSAEPNHYGLYMNTPPWRKRNEQPNIIKPEPVQLRNDYLYYADESPRSRRPISIKTGQNGTENQYLSDSQTLSNNTNSICRRPRNASEFWKKIDDAERQRQQKTAFANSRSNSEYSSNSQIYKPISEQNKLIGKNFYKTENADIQNKNKSIDTSDAAKIWKATTEYKRAHTVEPSNIAMSPTSKTHIRHKSDTFVTNSFPLASDDEKSSERRKSTNLDDALNELEAIYNSLGLGDEDLLDRAERRELMTPKFNDQFNDWNGNDNEIQLRSQPTTPLRRISRRSTLPDKLQDDMAFRRMNSFSSKDKPSYKEAQAQISYMLASPVYIPYVSDDDKHSERNEPDIVYDDVVYRNIKQTNNRLKTIEPQPPFGIPVGPVSPAPQSDYLHATPENKGRSRFVPKRSPDIVSDDLAYRSLRKDNKHTSLFNNEDSTHTQINNNQSYRDMLYGKDSSENIKKKRAIRSLSANIFTMIQKEIDEALNINKAPVLQKTHSNSDVMRRLRETYENKEPKQEFYPRNKVKQRNNTVNILVNNPHNSTHHFAKDDSFIHCDDKCFAKSSSCEKSKSSSPSHKSPQSSKRSSKDGFQQVLSMLAQEAMDTSNKLGVALAELDKNRNTNENTTDLQNKIAESRQSFLNELTHKYNDNTETEGNHTKVFPNVFNKNSLEDHDNKIKAKKTEDSLFTISNQLNKVEDQLKYSFEKDLKFNDESIKLSNYNNTPPEVSKAEEGIENTQNKIKSPDVVPVLMRNDTIEIKNQDENTKESEILIHPQINSYNPFLNPTNKMKELDEIKAFKELKDGISDLIAGISEVNEKLFLTKVTKDDKTNEYSEISEVSHTPNQVKRYDGQEVTPERDSTIFSEFKEDIDLKRDAAESTEYNSSEELASIFNLNNNKTTQALTEISDETVNKPRDDLNSPNLVRSMNQHLRRLSVDEGDTSHTNALPCTVVPWRIKNQCNSSEKEPRASNNTQSKRNWHDSGTLMLACSYTLMLSQHLTDMDWLTLLGLLLAMITIIAMLLI